MKIEIRTELYPHPFGTLDVLRGVAFKERHVISYWKWRIIRFFL